MQIFKKKSSRYNFHTQFPIGVICGESPLLPGEMMHYPKDPQTYAIIGAAMEVHRHLGHGFLEAVYQEAFSRELALCGIPFAREVQLNVVYKGEALPCAYRADFICYQEIIVELKALSALSTIDEAQCINYLKATGMQRALLINFGALSLEYKRVVLGYVDHAQSRK